MPDPECLCNSNRVWPRQWVLLPYIVYISPNKEKEGEKLGLNVEEVAFYDALAENEASVRELGDETLKKIAIELTDNLRRSTTVDWSVRQTVRARLRLMVKRILRKYKYPPDLEQAAVDLVLQQAETLSESWVSG